jgi:hypothetical protein
MPCLIYYIFNFSRVYKFGLTPNKSELIEEYASVANVNNFYLSFKYDVKMSNCTKLQLIIDSKIWLTLFELCINMGKYWKCDCLVVITYIFSDWFHPNCQENIEKIIWNFTASLPFITDTSTMSRAGGTRGSKVI